MSIAVSNEIQSSAIAKVGSWMRLLFIAAVRLWVARRDERILREAPAQQLLDIGIARADIRRALRSGRIGCR
jgi:uncharacterized protein YjiS (DUF1127 family)